jgi:epoxyqueuosine reductase QueG
MGNGRDRRFLPRLEQWAAAEDDPVLAEAAAWAIRRIASLQ